MLIVSASCVFASQPGWAQDTPSPEGASSQLAAAQAALAAARYDEAIHHFRRHLEHAPASYDARYGLGVAYYRAERTADALALFEQMLEAMPDNADVLLMLGFAELQRGRPERALDRFGDVLRQVPSYPDAWQGRGRAYEQLDRYREAEEAFTAWVELAEARPEPYLARARARMSLRRRALARADLLAAEGRGADAPTIAGLLRALDREARPGSETFLAGLAQRSFDGGLSSWQTYHVGLQAEARSRAAGALYHHAARPGSRHDALQLFGVHDLWRSAYLEAEAGRALRGDHFARTLLGATLHQRVGAGWILSGTYRWADRSALDVHTVGLGGAYYYRAWYGAVRLEETRAGGDRGALVAATLRRFFDAADTFAELQAGLGEPVLSTTGLDPLLRNSTRFVQLAGQVYVGNAFGVHVSAGLYHENGLPPSVGLATRLLRHF